MMHYINELGGSYDVNYNNVNCVKNTYNRHDKSRRTKELEPNEEVLALKPLSVRVRCSRWRRQAW